MYRFFFKRLIDLIFSFVALLAFSPIMLAIAIGLAFYNQGKVFFLQERPGRNERIFKVIKFKTMNDRKDASGNLLPSVDRTTPLGNILRKYSLDELPQLINVFKGDMSLIGPRPLLVQYLALYSEEQKRRHLVRPGITGWAQTNGRNTISWSDKFKLDIYYIDNFSLKLDLKILITTVSKVVKGSDINASAANTMPTFNGRN